MKMMNFVIAKRNYRNVWFSSTGMLLLSGFREALMNKQGFDAPKN
jgi:hypothetical protein